MKKYDDKLKDLLDKYIEELPEFCAFSEISVDSVGGFGNTPLHMACARGAADEVQMLIKAGADANAEGEMRSRPLHDAVRGGNPEVIAILLKAGAVANVVNDFGKTPLEDAMYSGSVDIIEILKNTKKSI